jgi:hypothetical protein
VYYWPEVQNFFGLKPWAKGAPRAVVQQFATALEANDVAGVESTVDTSVIKVKPDDQGNIATVGPEGQGMMQPAPPTREQVTITGSISDAPVTYEFSQVRAGASIEVATKGGTAAFKLKPMDGQLKIIAINVTGPPGGGAGAGPPGKGKGGPPSMGGPGGKGGPPGMGGPGGKGGPPDMGGPPGAKAPPDASEPTGDDEPEAPADEPAADGTTEPAGAPSGEEPTPE